MNPLLLSSLPTRHPVIGYALWDDAAALIARLAHDPRPRGGESCPVTVRWTPLGSAARDEVRHLSWEGESLDRLMAAECYVEAHPEREVTGRAAVVTCALLLHALDGIVLGRVAAYGDRGDFRLGGDVGMVEVSGIRSGSASDLRARAREKADQLFENEALGYGVVSATMFEDPNGDVVSVLRHYTRRDWEESS